MPLAHDPEQTIRLLKVADRVLTRLTLLVQQLSGLMLTVALLLLVARH